MASSLERAGKKTAKELLDLAASVKNVTSDLRDAFTEKDRLEDELQTLQTALTQKKKERDVVDANQTALFQETQSLHAKTATDVEACIILSKSIRSFETQLEQLQLEATKKLLEIDHVEHEISSEQEATRSLEELATRIRSEMTTLKAERDMYKIKCNESARTAEQLKGKILHTEEMHERLEQALTAEVNQL